MSAPLAITVLTTLVALAVSPAEAEVAPAGDVEDIGWTANPVPPPVPPSVPPETIAPPPVVDEAGEGQSPSTVTASGLAGPGIGEVELSGTRWQSLQPQKPQGSGPLVVRREVQLRRADDGVTVRARYWLRGGGDSVFAGHVAGPTAQMQRLRWNGRPVTSWPSPQGTLVVERIDGPSILEVEAFVPGHGDERSVVVLPAPRGTVTLEGFADDIVLSGDERPVILREGRWWTGSGELGMAPRDPQPRDRGPLAVALVGLGVTVGDAEVRGHARLRWEIRQGTRTDVSFSLDGVGDDLTVEGPLVSRWERSGSRVEVELSGPTQGRVDLDVRWSIATPGGAEATVPLPTIVPDDVFRSAVAVQVARDGEVDVRPVLERSWRPIARAQLPDFAEGLVEGTPTAAYVRPRASASGDTLQLLRLEPVPGPPMVVDVADMHVATTEEGRALVRVRYEIRNERASHLTVTPPPGMRLAGVEMGGRPVTPAIDGPTLRIPLKRSLETINGPLTVPVTIAFLGEAEAWERRERREMPLPAVDAPVNVARITLHLPPGYRSRLEPGEYGVVDGFTEGQGVGYGLGDDQLAAKADRVFSRAVDAWNANDFEGAQDALAELGRMGALGSNADGLQANVDLVMPADEEVMVSDDADADAFADDDDGVTVYDFEDDTIDGDMLIPEATARSAMPAPMALPGKSMGGAAARRIRARLRARSGKQKVEYDRRKRKAKKLKNEGRYDEAAAEYRQAIEDSRDLGRLEDEESVEYDYEAGELAEELRTMEKASRSKVNKFITEDAELDLVGGLFVVLRASTLTSAEDEELDEDEPVMAETAPILSVPRVGNGVQYQQLLLEASEQRTVRVDARRARERSGRRTRRPRRSRR